MYKIEEILIHNKIIQWWNKSIREKKNTMCSDQTPHILQRKYENEFKSIFFYKNTILIKY